MTKACGYTLLELLVVMLLILILSTLGISSYQRIIILSNREFASYLLLQQVSYLEQNYLQKGSYLHDGVNYPQLNASISLASQSSVYRFKFNPVPAVANSYSILAIPQANSIQAADGIICINQFAHISYPLAEGDDCRATSASVSPALAIRREVFVDE